MIFNLQELQNAIAEGENQTVEFKTSFSKEVIESIVAFANANGGSIIIGISDDSKIVGITLSSETLKDYINQIKQNTQPNIIVDINDYILEDKTVAVINIQEQPIKPIAYKNRYYKRVKNSNHQMSLDEITNEHFKTINASWDYCIDDRHDFNDISMDKIINLVEKIEKYQDKIFDDDPMTILRKYELIKDGKLTFGAYLLFTSNVSAITAFQIGRFKSPTDIIDNIDIDTDIITQIDVAIEFIKKHLMTEFIITGEPQRTMKYDYPLGAIREIVINMIVHRDYRDSGNSIIKIFDDKIEFFNPGKLYGDITIEQLISGNYASKTRNRAIARIFKEAGIIERYGSGIARIQNECRMHGMSEPLFEEFSHGFRVTLFKEKINEGINEGINSLYVYIQNNPNQRISQIEKSLNIPAKTLERWIKQLKEDDVIQYIGSKKTGGYVAK